MGVMGRVAAAVASGDGVLEHADSASMDASRRGRMIFFMQVISYLKLHRTPVVLLSS